MNRKTQQHVMNDKILKTLNQIAFADIRKLFDKNNNLKNIHEIPLSLLPALESVEVVKKSVKGEDFEVIKYKFFDKNKALTILMELFKLASIYQAPDGEIHLIITSPYDKA